MKKRTKKIILAIVIILILLAIAVYLFYLALQPQTTIKVPGQNAVAPAVIPKEPTYKPINFQSVVDAWANANAGNKSILIYDLDRDQLVGSHNPTENYNTASLYKLFVAYEGYRRLSSGTWQESDPVAGRTRLECLDLAIRESHSPCAEALWAEIGKTELDQIIKADFKIENARISSLTANAEDILKIMQLFYQHSDIDPEYWTKIQDSMLNQPPTTYDWRRGLPNGFSADAKVYNKVGWHWNGSKNRWDIYHDAAIIEFPAENRHFIVIVMTNFIPHQKIADLGKKIETFYHANK